MVSCFQWCSNYYYPSHSVQNVVGGAGAKFVIVSRLDKNAFQLNANHPLAESTGYIKFEGM